MVTPPTADISFSFHHRSLAIFGNFCRFGLLMAVSGPESKTKLIHTDPSIFCILVSDRYLPGSLSWSPARQTDKY